MGWAYLTHEEAQRTIEPNTLTHPVVTTQPLWCHRDIEDTDLIEGNLLSDEMKINLHMLRALMLNEVSGEVHDADVVVVDESAAWWRSLELMQELAQPGGLRHIIGDGTVLGFGAEASRLVDQETRLSPRNTT
jgi:hypothetical protein